MTTDFRELSSSFLIFMQNLRELFAKQQPEVWNLLDSKGFSLKKDPFGKYYNTIYMIGNQEPCNMTEFADFFHLSPGTATGIIDKMVDRKLITRVPNANDRRKVELMLTDRGKFIFEKAKDFEKNQIQTLLSSISAEDITFAKQLIDKLNAHPLFSSLDNVSE